MSPANFQSAQTSSPGDSAAGASAANRPAAGASCPCCGQPIDRDVLMVDRSAGQLHRDGRSAQLTEQQLHLFDALKAAFPAMVSDHALQGLVIGEGRTSIRRVIFDVRKRIRPLGLDIANAHGRGYRLTGLSR